MRTLVRVVRRQHTRPGSVSRRRQGRGRGPGDQGLRGHLRRGADRQPADLERKARNLARYQRRLARCQRGSANRAKAKAKVARAHRKVRAARTDFLHKATTRLVRDHDVIVLEDLAVKNMVRNRKLAKAISDCGWGTFRVMIEYKAARYGRRVITVDRWYPSSKTCSACGYLPRGPEPQDPDVAVPVLRHPARPGHQRREEHPGGRSCRSRGQPRPCLRS